MSLFIASLNSGSNGNCYYVGNENEAVFVDAGISCREIEKRMAKLQLKMSNVKALFISHEHTDHIKGVVSVSKKYKLPVYITNAVLRNSGIQLRNSAVSFEAGKTIQIGALTVIPFSKHHDAVEPCSFIVESEGIKISVITDIGIACEQVVHYFKQSHAVFLESNYDERMLAEGTYATRLKERISGGKGHLSNSQALQLFIKHRPAYMSHVLLSHLSKNNNHPKIVQDLFSKHANNTTIVVASRYRETDVYHIQNTEGRMPIKKHEAYGEPVQLMLFD